MSEFKNGNENDIAVSTRIRLARNIKGIPYPRKMTQAQAEKVIETVYGAFDNSPLKSDLTLYKISSLSDIEKNSMIERHLISTELASSRWGAVIINKDETLSIMINEEDHIRIQSFVSGLDATGAYDNAKKIEAVLSETITFDTDEQFGFLTACPTNVGTGLRASVMLHLPSISATQNIGRLLKWAANLGMTVRGLYGEGSKSSGALFQLSNQITLGASEEEIVSRFNAAACSLISEERRICRDMFEKNKYALTDKCLRSLGILKNAYMISSSEAMNLVSNVCMGTNLGIIKNIDNNLLRKTLFETMPATLSKNIGELRQEERDIRRAQLLQGAL